MYGNIYECMAGGGRYAAYLRIALSDGTVLTEKAVVSLRRYGTDNPSGTDGSYAVELTAKLTEYRLGGRTVARVGLTDRDGGNELLGAPAFFALDGGLEITVTCALVVSVPGRGFRSEKWSGALTGRSPLPALTALSDAGESVPVSVSADDGGLKLAAEFTRGMKYFTLLAGGEPALLIRHGGEREVSGTVKAAADDEIYPRVSNQTGLVGLTVEGGSGTELAPGAETVEVPLSLGEEEEVILPAGGIESFGGYLTVRNESAVYLFGPGGKLLAARGGRGIKCVTVSDGGVMAFADGERIRVCGGSADLCEISDTADSLVLTDEENGGHLLHCLSGGRLNGVKISADGSATETYSVSCDSMRICGRAGSVFGIGKNYMRLYSAGGEELSRLFVNGGGVEKIIGMNSGFAVVLGADGRYYVLTPYSQRGAAGTPKAVSGRLVLTEEGELYAYDRPADRTVCPLEAESAAYADGKLYYARKGNFFFRRASETERRIVSGGAFYGDTVSFTVRAEGESAGACATVVTLALT